MYRLGKLVVGLVLFVLAIKFLQLFFWVLKVAIGLAIIIGIAAALTGRWNQYVASLKRIVGMS